MKVMNKADYILDVIMALVLLILYIFFAFCRAYQFDWDLLVLIIALIVSLASGIVWWRQGKKRKRLEEEQEELQNIVEVLREGLENDHAPEGENDPEFTNV